MDYTRGIVVYDLKGTARRVGVSVATVKRHVAVLRELGALVWLVHGSKRNLRMPGRKYTATATIYGAVIPRCYDDAMGHRLTGHGYSARVCGITDQGRQLAVTAAKQPQPEPHSLGPSPRTPASVESGVVKATRPARSTKKPRKTILGRSVTAAAFAAAHRIATAVRPLVNWAQHATHSQLAWVLIDKVLEGWDLERVHMWLREVNPADRYGPRFRPERPHAYIAAQLRLERALRDEERERCAPQPKPTTPNGAFAEALHLMRTGSADKSPCDVPQPCEGPSNEELQDLRHAAAAAYLANDTDLITSAVRLLGKKAAEGLYGPALVEKTMRLKTAHHEKKTSPALTV
ncbi:hypothetical protein [Streptomyces lydicus]|uniref:hypothetical protein n=1 Tax=Streptomyces lydicus TaxID=47763 RepID=UPI0036E34F4F